MNSRESVQRRGVSVVVEVGRQKVGGSVVPSEATVSEHLVLYCPFRAHDGSEGDPAEKIWDCPPARGLLGCLGVRG